MPRTKNTITERTSFHIQTEVLTALRSIAATQQTSTSKLLRDGAMLILNQHGIMDTIQNQQHQQEATQ